MALARPNAALHARSQSPVANRCECCRRLNISHLVEFAKVDLPYLGQLQANPGTYIHHHNSVDALEISADTGCDVCSFIVSTLRGYEKNDK
jgi:hypothetical protein